MARISPLNVPRPVLLMALLFFAVHSVRQILPSDADEWVLLAFAFIPARYGGASAILPGGVGACFWSPLSYALLHADWVHLGVNVVWMFSFGSPLARRFGAFRFLTLSVAAAIAGAAAHFLMHPSEEGLVIGASGAVSGMMAATARFAFSPGGALAPIDGTRRDDLPAESLWRVLTGSRALGFILVWFAVNLAFGLAGDAVPGASGPIAWEAHVGGFLAGLLLFPLLDPIVDTPPPALPSPEDELASGPPTP